MLLVSFSRLDLLELCILLPMLVLSGPNRPADWQERRGYIYIAKLVSTDTIKIHSFFRKSSYNCS